MSTIQQVTKTLHRMGLGGEEQSAILRYFKTRAEGRRSPSRRKAVATRIGTAGQDAVLAQHDGLGVAHHLLPGA